jgi:hypothetical protein
MQADLVTLSLPRVAALLVLFVALGALAPAASFAFPSETHAVTAEAASSNFTCKVVRWVSSGSTPARLAVPLGEPGELVFTYEDWSQADEDSLRAWEMLLRPVVSQLLGPPALPGTWVVRHDPASPYSGYCDYLNNLIVLNARPTQDPNVIETFAHEWAHAIEDNFLPWEEFAVEGFAEAFTPLALAKLPPYYRSRNDGHTNSLNVTEAIANQPAIAGPMGNSNLQTLRSLRNRLAGAFFWRLEVASGETFFQEFHEVFFERCRQIPDFPENRAAVRTLMRYVQPIIDEMPAQEVWDACYDSHLDWVVGDDLFLYGDRIGAVCFWRDHWGGEYPHGNVLVDWQVDDDRGQVLASGSMLTTGNGRALPYPTLPPCTGKGTVRFQAHLPGEIIERSRPIWLSENFPPDFSGYGLFGIADGPDGPVDVAALDGSFHYTGAIENGSFRLPQLDGVAGTYRITWNGMTIIVRKDTGSLLVLLSEETMHQVGVADPPVPALTLALSCAPNPFRESTQITITATGPASLGIYDVAGRLLKTFPDPTSTQVRWDGRTDDGIRAARGTYFLKLRGGGREVMTKVLVLD